jgi:hypothetical protein
MLFTARLQAARVAVYRNNDLFRSLKLAPVRGSAASRSLLQLDRFLGAGFHAETASPASIGVDDKCLFPAVYKQFEPSHQGEFGFLFRRSRPDGENVVRTNRHARSCCFAAHGVDDRHHNTWIKLAVGIRLRHRPPHATGMAKPIIQHAPQNASAFALPAPISFGAPVTAAALPFNFAMILTFCSLDWPGTVSNNVSQTRILCRRRQKVCLLTGCSPQAIMRLP